MTDRISKIVARIPKMPTRERAEWHSKASRVLALRPDDPDAIRLIKAIESAEEQPDTTRLISTGCLVWEPRVFDRPDCRGFAGGVAVARIFKSATHTESRKKVYSVEVNGQLLSDNYHRVEEARQAGEAAYQIGQGSG